MDSCVVSSCGVVRVGGCGVGGGLGVMSIAVGGGWGAVGEVLGDVAIVMIVRVMVGGVWSILVVVAVLGYHFLPLLKFLVQVMLVSYPAKFYSRLPNPALLGWLISSGLLCLARVTSVVLPTCIPFACFGIPLLTSRYCIGFRLCDCECPGIIVFC